MNGNNDFLQTGTSSWHWFNYWASKRKFLSKHRRISPHWGTHICLIGAIRRGACLFKQYLKLNTPYFIRFCHSQCITISLLYYPPPHQKNKKNKIGRASCRERE